MTREQIEHWAIETGIYPVYSGDPAMQDKIDALNAQHLAQVERFVALVAAHEREQCALLCESFANQVSHWPDAFEGATAETQFIRGVGDALMKPFAEAIRARGDVPES